MRILITGGAGFIGSHCAEHFARKGHEVIVVDNLMRSKLFRYPKKSVEYNWDYLSELMEIIRIKADVRLVDDMIKAIGGGVDVAIHAAAQPGVPSSVRAPMADFSINALGTINVLECLRRKSRNVKFIYCSTNKVYGENVSGIPIEESERRYAFKDTDGINEGMSVDLTGHTPYGVSKLAGDLCTQEYAHIYEMKTAVFRMGSTYGPRQFGFEDQGWVAHFTVATLLGRPITIFGNGKQVRDLLYIDDLVDAFEKFINSDLRAGVFNIGGGTENSRSLLEVLDELEALTGKRPKAEFSSWRASDQKVYISDNSKVKEALSWQPKVAVKDGLQKLVDWVKKNETYFS